MIRFFLLGGQWGPVPSSMLLALGGSAIAAAGLLFLLAPSPAYLWLVAVESAVLGGIGSGLLAVGALRRRRERKRS